MTKFTRQTTTASSPNPWVLAALLTLLTNGISSHPITAAVPTEKMNILLIVVEDLSSFAVGCYGNNVVQTSNIDKLAGRSVVFDRAYCQATVCNPSRASLVTGLRADSTRVFRNSDIPDDLVPASAPSMADLLQGPDDAFSASLGKLTHKWNESVRFAKGFDQIHYSHHYDNVPGIATVFMELERGPAGIGEAEEEFGYLADRAVAKRLIRLRNERDNKLEAGAEDNWELRRPFQQLYAEQVGNSGLDAASMEDGRVARATARLIREHAHDSQPFFIVAGFYAPHTPLLAPREFVELYDPSTTPLSPATVDKDKGVPAVARRNGANYDIFNGLYPEFGPTEERQKAAIAAYYACASYVDSQIGLVLDALEESGSNENTIIVFVSDHGFHLGEHGCWSKFTLFEQSTRVPLIVHVPANPANGSRCDEIVEMVDILPTLCDYRDVKKPAVFEGTSFVELVANPTAQGKDAAFSCITLGGLGRSVRTKRFRYTEYRRDLARPSKDLPPFARELYDLENDPWEQVNLVHDPAYAKVLKEMQEKLVAGPS